jgi:hypothetical protein
VHQRWACRNRGGAGALHVNADCEDCWRDPATPRAAPGTLALDWVLPGRKGDDAPLSAVALRRGAGPAVRWARRFRSQRRGHEPARGCGRLRLAHGEAFNDYIGTSIELKEPGRERWRAWLLLVEQLPAGTEGQPGAAQPGAQRVPARLGPGRWRGPGTWRTEDRCRSTRARGPTGCGWWACCRMGTRA